MRRFFEISDYNQAKFDNLELTLKLVRFFIRMNLRILGFKSGLIILKNLIKLFDLFSKNKKINFISYIFKINYYYVSYLYNLFKNDINSSVNSKFSLANIIINQSYDKSQIENAKLYKEIMSNLDNSNEIIMNYNSSKMINNNTNKKIYIYGPNSHNQPNEKYSDYTLVVFKPFVDNLDKFKNKLLFINASCYLNDVLKDNHTKDFILDNFDKCYVSATNIDLISGFELIDNHSTGHLGSLMGLGRILSYLKKKYKFFDCVIEGIDFYLSDNPYNKRYPEAYSRKYPGEERDINKNNDIYESYICTGLAHHDFIYNFIYIKLLMKDLNIIDSDDFMKIFKLNNNEYINKLIMVRDFKQLNKIFLFR